MGDPTLRAQIISARVRAPARGTAQYHCTRAHAPRGCLGRKAFEVAVIDDVAGHGHCCRTRDAPLPPAVCGATSRVESGEERAPPCAMVLKHSMRVRVGMRVRACVDVLARDLDQLALLYIINVVIIIRGSTAADRQDLVTETVKSNGWLWDRQIVACKGAGGKLAFIRFYQI